LVYELLVEGKDIPYNPIVFELGIMYGIIAEKKGKLAIHNRIFETLLYDYLLVQEQMRKMAARFTSVDKSKLISDNRLNMEDVLAKFGEFMEEQYRQEDERFYETNGRLIFLAYLKPILNGRGFSFVEAQTRGNRRMDIVVTFGAEKFVIELKLWNGQKYEEKGLLEEAIKEYESALGLTPDRDICNSLSLLHYELGNTQEAINYCNMTLDIDPGYSWAYSNLGTIYRELGEVEKALINYEKAIETGEEDDYEAECFVYCNLGLLYYQKEKYEEAAGNYRHAISIDPYNAIAHYELALTYSKMEQFDSAIHHYKKTLEIEPQDYFACYELGKILFRKDNIYDAVMYLEKALPAARNLPKIYYDMAMAYQRQNRRMEAIEYLKKYLLLEPEGEEGENAKAYLETL